MSSFEKRFIIGVTFFDLIIGVIMNTLIQMTFEYITIDTELSAMPKIIFIMFTAGIAYPLFAIGTANYFTRYLKGREYYMSNSRIFPFYRNYVLAASAIIAADLIFLYLKSRPFFAYALNDAVVRIKIMELSSELEDKRIVEINNIYDKCLSVTTVLLVAVCLLQAAILLISAKKLVNTYNNQDSVMLK